MDKGPAVDVSVFAGIFVILQVVVQICCVTWYCHQVAVILVFEFFYFLKMQAQHFLSDLGIQSFVLPHHRTFLLFLRSFFFHFTVSHTRPQTTRCHWSVKQSKKCSNTSNLWSKHHSSHDNIIGALLAHHLIPNRGGGEVPTCILIVLHCIYIWNIYLMFLLLRVTLEFN